MLPLMGLYFLRSLCLFFVNFDSGAGPFLFFNTHVSMVRSALYARLYSFTSQNAPIILQSREASRPKSLRNGYNMLTKLSLYYTLRTREPVSY